VQRLAMSLATSVSRHVISLNSRDQRDCGSDRGFTFGWSVVSEFGISTANLRRAHGGCLGVKRMKGVEVCEKPGEVDK
jgi:hypothetical protein